MWTIKEIAIVFIPPWEHDKRNEISSKQNKNIRRYVETRDFFYIQRALLISTSANIKSFMWVRNI